MRLSEANAVNDLISVLAGQCPYQVMPSQPLDEDRIAAAVETLAVAAWVATSRAGWRPGDAVRAVITQLRRQGYGEAYRRETDAMLGPEGPPEAQEPAEVVEHEVSEETKREIRVALLRNATTEQLLASQDELQAAVTAGPPELVPAVASTLRQVQVELSARYHAVRTARGAPVKHARTEFENTPVQDEPLTEIRFARPAGEESQR
jgi:hypothetical protein